MQRTAILVAIKLVHTAVWAFFAGCILAIPYYAARHDFRSAAVLSALVWIECLVLALNRATCPLTDLAARYTEERQPNFDIYLPLWLAQYNKMIFGTIFIAAELYFAALWLAT